jgi:hypothetical protein
MEEYFLSCAQREKRNTLQFLLEVPAAEGPGFGGIRQTSHCSGNKGHVCGALTHSSCQRAAQNSAEAP